MNKSIIYTLFLLTSSAQAYDVEHIEIDSKTLETKTSVNVVLPDSYKQGQEHSVVYVLHGWSGNDNDWLEKTDIEKLADLYNVVIVLPDGDYDKWYIDSPQNPKVKYESYIGKELPNYIDKHFHTKKDKAFRAITGLSMGGFGAMNIAINNKDTFGNVGSISGGVDPVKYRYNWGLESVFGPYTENKEFWDKKVIANNAHRLLFSGMNIAIDCGVDDFFISSNRDLHEVLQNLRIDHDYTERPGGHTWDYWDNAIKYQMLFFSQSFSKSE